MLAYCSSGLLSALFYQLNHVHWVSLRICFKKILSFALLYIIADKFKEAPHRNLPILMSLLSALKKTLQAIIAPIFETFGKFVPNKSLYLNCVQWRIHNIIESAVWQDILIVIHCDTRGYITFLVDERVDCDSFRFTVFPAAREGNRRDAFTAFRWDPARILRHCHCHHVGSGSGQCRSKNPEPSLT